jgi:hypothetical protein
VLVRHIAVADALREFQAPRAFYATEQSVRSAAEFRVPGALRARRRHERWLSLSDCAVKVGSAGACGYACSASAIQNCSS